MVHLEGKGLPLYEVKEEIGSLISPSAKEHLRAAGILDSIELRSTSPNTLGGFGVFIAGEFIGEVKGYSYAQRVQDLEELAYILLIDLPRVIGLAGRWLEGLQRGAVEWRIRNG